MRLIDLTGLGCSSELNLYVGLVGAAVVLLPFFFISFMFKIGDKAYLNLC